MQNPINILCESRLKKPENALPVNKIQLSLLSISDFKLGKL